MIIFCICVVLASLFFLIAWFFHAIEVAQKEIDKRDTE
jgi:hypothetical protein